MSESKAKERTALQREEYAVGIGFPCGSTIPWQTAMALTRTVHVLAKYGIPVEVHPVAGSSLVTIARSVVLGEFLKTQSKFLFWIDSDIDWKPEDFLRVLGLTMRRGIVCAAYPLKQEPEQIILNFATDPPVLDEEGCVEITGVGLGFTCIRRDIIDEFAKTKSTVRHPGNNARILDAFRLDYTRTPDGEDLQFRGEDVAFFADLRALGHKVWLDSTISLGHVGNKVYRASLEEITPTGDSDV